MDAELQAKLDVRRSLVERRPLVDVQSDNHGSFPSPRAVSSSCKSFPSQDANTLPNASKVELSSLAIRNTTFLERLRHLSETSRLLVENGHMAPQRKQFLQHRQKFLKEAHKSLTLGSFPTTPTTSTSPLWFESTLETLGDEKLKHEEPSQVCTHRQDDVVVGELQNSSTEHAATLASLQKQNTELRQQNECLSMELSNMQKKFEHLEDQLRRDTSSCESHLRHVLCDNSSSMDDLKQAINASEALLNEAKREHANKKFRAKRAAPEGLEVAVEKEEDETLFAAIVVAQQADVDAVDLEKAEEKLKTLREMTQEQRAANTARELLQKQKKIAFTLVKKDDVMNFKELINEVGEGVSWRDWKDPLGRTVWRCAKDVRALRMQEFLKQLGVGDVQIKAKVQRLMSKQILQQTEPQQQQCQQQEQGQQQQQEDMNQTQCFPVDEHTEVVQHRASLDLSECRVDSSMDSNCSSRCPTGDSIAIVKSKAFRATAQDDFGTLNEIIGSVSVDIWSKWENRAGKTLLTLSEERRSATVHSQIAKALGILKQSKRETFEERESVWVYVKGDVQPKRATVLANTLEAAEMIPIEYWEGNQPATCVNRCSVRKMFC